MVALKPTFGSSLITRPKEYRWKW